jgi:hypothetical protein
MEDNDPTGYKEAMEELRPLMVRGCSAQIAGVACFPLFVALQLNGIRMYRTIRRELFTK